MRTGGAPVRINSGLHAHDYLGHREYVVCASFAAGRLCIAPLDDLFRCTDFECCLGNAHGCATNKRTQNPVLTLSCIPLLMYSVGARTLLSVTGMCNP